MKSKRRHRSSSEESDDSEDSGGSSSSESESEESHSDHRHRKRRKRAESSDSDSESDDHRRSKKKKQKKKKKKHGKRKRRSDSAARSDSEDNLSSISEGEVSPKKKRKKHKQKRSRSSSASVIEVEPTERRLHSVVKERRRSPEEENIRTSRTYYQKEYRSNSPRDPIEMQRENEVQRFYRGSSKERRMQEQYHYDNRDHHDRYYEPCPQEVQYSYKHSIHPITHISDPNDDLQTRQRDFKPERNSRYEGQRPPHDEYQRRQRDEYYPREPPKGGFNRPNHYEERGPKRSYEEGRDYRERRGPPEPDRFREREFPERRERYREEPFHPDRGRDMARDNGPPRPDKPPPRNNRNEEVQHRSEEDRSKDRGRRPEPREERPPRELREERPPREPREDRPPREPRDDRPPREPREDRPPREPRDERPPREPRDDRPERPRARNDRPHGNGKKSRFADAEDSKEYSWGKTEVKKEGTKEGEKEKPNFGLSGKLTADANTVNGVVIKYTEPDDAKQPKRRWRFYPFKGDKALPILYIHRQSAFLIGRDKKVADIPLEHPSISKQHAALQYRATPFTRADGSTGRRVRPYVIDLESANGTFVNNKKIEPRRYVELLEKDVVKFGFSLREYVLLHENSKDEGQDDDNVEPALTTDLIKREKRAKEEVQEDGE